MGKRPRLLFLGWPYFAWNLLLLNHHWWHVCVSLFLLLQLLADSSLDLLLLWKHMLAVVLTLNHGWFSTPRAHASVDFFCILGRSTVERLRVLVHHLPHRRILRLCFFVLRIQSLLILLCRCGQLWRWLVKLCFLLVIHLHLSVDLRDACRFKFVRSDSFVRCLGHYGITTRCILVVLEFTHGRLQSRPWLFYGWFRSLEHDAWWWGWFLALEYDRLRKVLNCSILLSIHAVTFSMLIRNNHRLAIWVCWRLPDSLLVVLLILRVITLFTLIFLNWFYF